MSINISQTVLLCDAWGINGMRQLTSYLMIVFGRIKYYITNQNLPIPEGRGAVFRVGFKCFQTLLALYPVWMCSSEIHGVHYVQPMLCTTYLGGLSAYSGWQQAAALCIMHTMTCSMPQYMPSSSIRHMMQWWFHIAMAHVGSHLGIHYDEFPCSKQNCIQCGKYSGYLSQTNTMLFTIPSTIKQAKFHICSIFIELAYLAILFILQLRDTANTSLQLSTKLHSH